MAAVQDSIAPRTMVSINTNANQLSALQLLNGANGQLHEIENRIATGLKVATAKDNGAIWGMAVAARSALGDYEVLDRARDHANGLVDVTLSATEVVSDLVDRMNELALASTDPSLSDTARASLNEQFQMLKRQIDRTVGSASFDGINLLDSNKSNFLDYGPGVIENEGAPAITWGSPSRTSQEPLAGEPLNLHFGFAGKGQQSERIEGTVSYKLRYFDGGSAVELSLANHTIPTSPAIFVGPSLPAYDAAETVSMPAIPNTATGVQIYAEYGGRYPSPDGDPVDDVIGNGAPRSDLLAQSVPHLLAQWNERDWSSTFKGRNDHTLGFGNLSAASDIDPAQAVSGGTEPGSIISGTIRLSDLDLGIDSLGASATVLYEVFDVSMGNWVTKATVPTTATPYGPATAPIDLSYNFTLPNPSPNEDFSRARLTAVVRTQHDGQAIMSGGVSTQPSSSVEINSVYLTQPQTGDWRSEWAFPEALSGGLAVQGVLKPQSSNPGEVYNADTNFIFRWNDGSAWHEQSIGALSLEGLKAGYTVDPRFKFELPPVAGPIAEAQVVARTKVVHDPAGTPTVENNEVTFMDWDGTTPTVHYNSIELGTFDNSVPALNKDPRRLEITTKIETLDSISGDTTPIREKDTRTVGLTGLSLEASSIGTADDARKALRYVKAAQARVTAQTLYYAGRADAFSSLQRMEAKIADQTQINLGQLVDADLAKEAARLEAAKVKQSLITQALSIANSLPAMVLSLFQSGSSRR